MNSPHKPVMLREVLQVMQPKDGGVYLDCTFGAGGYSRAILQTANCHLIALDRDPNVANIAAQFKQEFAQNFEFREACFADMAQICAEFSPFDAIVMDIGVSSMQLDQGARGFSFRHDGALDMRMSNSGASAADLVNHAPQAQLADILWQYGEEKQSRKIANAIIKQREIEPITTTFQLRDIIYGVIRPRGDKIDPATRSFQALRIAVNDELGQLKAALNAAINLLKVGGRLVVVAFHSLEDRIIKHFFQKLSGIDSHSSRHSPSILDAKINPIFTLAKDKSMRASAEEIAENPRSRSAILRYGIRTNATYHEGAYA